MTQREAFHATLAGERPEVLCQFEWGYWPETVERWHGEGLPVGVEPWDHCGILNYERPPLQRGIWPEFPIEVLEEDDRSRVIRNEAGIVLRESKLGLRLPQFIKHPVATRADWEAIKERLDPATPGRYPPEDEWQRWLAWVRETRHLVCLGRRENGFFGWLRELMGLEGLLYAYVDQPDLVHEICRYHLTFLQGLYGRTLREAQIDFVFMWEDMAYKGGPLISPGFFREFMLPYYREMVDFYRQMGARWIVVDSDGDIRQLTPLFVEAGVDGLLPFEVAAGNDILAVREAFPRLTIIGGVDKRPLAVGREAIDRELAAKLPAMFARGRYLPTVDHHLPPNVPYDNFRYYLEACRRLYAAG